MLGYILGLLSILVLITIVVYSLCLLDGESAPTLAVEEKFLIAKLIAHALITVAGVYFCYQLMRIAERLVVPHWWKAPMVRAMLGIEGPLMHTALKRFAALSGAFGKAFSKAERKDQD